MGIRLQKAIFHNRAPFEHLELNFGDENVAILSGINGRGKTTIISHIVDAFYEMARKTFPKDFEGKETKYYRISSPNQNINQDNPSFVYFRFFDKKIIDYLDIRNNCSEEEYNATIKLEGKIPYYSFNTELERRKCIKRIHNNSIEIDSLFYQNLLTYFPSYRYEQPGYLNNPYKINLKFNINHSFTGYLNNPIEVISDLPNIANWIMDVFLDKFLKNDGQSDSLYKQVQNLISMILNKGKSEYVRLGIGERKQGITRIDIVEKINGKERELCPSIFYLSAGEASLLCLFGELLKQADKNGLFYDLPGIVLIDEVDKHLHIKLQKEVLPKLFTLFPKIQFIVSSHSPFFSMGVADEKALKSIVFDLDNNGIPTTAENNDLYQEVYTMMIEKNKQYAAMYNKLKQKVEEDAHTLIITEGKTDRKHLQNAFIKLGLMPLDVEFVDIDQIENGASLLLRRLKDFAILRRNNKVIGIFDRDDDDILKELNDGEVSYKPFGNRVYAFVIPLVNEEEYGNKISIEHYYHKKDLLKEDQNHRRLFLGKEFDEFSGISKDEPIYTKANYKHKVPINGIIDEKVYKTDDKTHTNIALSKNAFAELVSDDSYAKDFDFSNFRKIYDKIKKIIDIKE
jgi:predicted ATP-binding protein involved in virulence